MYTFKVNCNTIFSFLAQNNESIMPTTHRNITIIILLRMYHLENTLNFPAANNVSLSFCERADGENGGKKEFEPAKMAHLIFVTIVKETLHRARVTHNRKTLHKNVSLWLFLLLV